jgi:adenylate cyclase
MEIERKYLVDRELWQKLGDTVKSVRILQGYLAGIHGCSVRIRISDDEAWLTIKGPSKGFSREEFEYAIPADDAVEIINMSQAPVIQKVRYEMDHGRHPWIVDVFHGDNEGLILAEKELDSEEEDPGCPVWVTAEVTGDQRYYNMALATHPINSWK